MARTKDNEESMSIETAFSEIDKKIKVVKARYKKYIYTP